MRVRVYVTFVPPKKRKWRKLKKKQNKKKHFIFLAARERSFPHFSSNKNFAAGHLQIFLFGWQAVHFFPRYRKIGKSESVRQSFFFFPCFSRFCSLAILFSLHFSVFSCDHLEREWHKYTWKNDKTRQWKGRIYPKWHFVYWCDNLGWWWWLKRSWSGKACGEESPTTVSSNEKENSDNGPPERTKPSN